jgi:hypothetical protein
VPSALGVAAPVRDPQRPAARVLGQELVADVDVDLEVEAPRVAALAERAREVDDADHPRLARLHAERALRQGREERIARAGPQVDLVAEGRVRAEEVGGAASRARRVDHDVGDAEIEARGAVRLLRDVDAWREIAAARLAPRGL